MFYLFNTDLAGVNAPEFPKNLTWLNSQPLTIQQMRGKVVLIDFWTYSCINCQRTLPYLRNWWDKYQKQGFVLIGVHTPEFEFEKDIRNVKEAIKKYQVTWPIVLDNNYQIWDSYSNHYWPAKYLINKDGKIVYTHFGEGNYFETELEIQKALKDAGYKVTDQITEQLVTETSQLGQTPELYCGYKRGILGNPGGYIRDQPYFYDSSIKEKTIEPDILYLYGIWQAKTEFIEHARDTKELIDLLVLSYRAKKVYLVMESSSKEPIKVYVTLDGLGLTKKTAGADIQFDPQGRAYVQVQFSTLYNLIETETFGDHILRISTLEKGLRCFAFTFGS